MCRIAYLGPNGSYSSVAAEKFCFGCEKTACSSFKLVMDALVSGKCDYAVFPVENSVNGSVNQVMDLLQSTENVTAFKEITVKIDHRLAVLKEGSFVNVSRIFSHPQALEQCGDFIMKNYPNAALVSSESTAASIERLNGLTDACIIGAHVKDARLKLCPRNIADVTDNFTIFLLVRNGETEENLSSDKIYFSAVCLHETGGLLKLLKTVADGGLNMTKIQSRPVKGKAGEERFFIEAEADYSCERVKEVIAGIKENSLDFKLLGAYKSSYNKQ